MLIYWNIISVRFILILKHQIGHRTEMYNAVVYLCCSFVQQECRIEHLKLNFRSNTMILYVQDNVFVMVAAVIQYRCGKDKVEDAFYTLYNPHQQIEAYVNDGKGMRILLKLCKRMLLVQVFAHYPQSATQKQAPLYHPPHYFVTPRFGRPCPYE